MKFKPFAVKFSNEKLNKSISLPKYSNEPVCDSHDRLDHITFRNGSIVCKNCGLKLKLVPSWIVG